MDSGIFKKSESRCSGDKTNYKWLIAPEDKNFQDHDINGFNFFLLFCWPKVVFEFLNCSENVDFASSKECLERTKNWINLKFSEYLLYIVLLWYDVAMLDIILQTRFMRWILLCGKSSLAIKTSLFLSWG